VRGLTRRINLNYSEYHVVTSGCSFSDSHNYNWQHFLRDDLNFNLHSYGHTGVGNDHISTSTIYGISKLLEAGVDTSKIKVFVMWSSPVRHSFFISKSETPNYDALVDKLLKVPVNRYVVNPVYMTLHERGYIHDDNQELQSGWLMFTPSEVDWDTDDHVHYSNVYFEQYYTIEHQIIKSLNNFLKLQWFCESKNIFLLNMSFKNIFDFEITDNIKHLMNLIDFDRWWFWKDRGGLFEYCKDNNLSFRSPTDDHPTKESHKYFTKNILINELNKRGAWGNYD
jgi:hypothetical protein